MVQQPVQHHPGKPRVLNRIRALAASLVLVTGAFPIPAGEPASPPVENPAARQATRSYDAPPAIDFRTPTRTYVERRSRDWVFQLEQELVDREPDKAEAVVTRLALKLDFTLDLLPANCRARLRALKFFVLLGPEATGGGRDNGAEYFQRIAPDHFSSLDPRWRSAIVIYCAGNYLWQNEHWSVQVLLHELAHAWQLEQWPEQQPEILNAWKHARSAGLYEGIKDVNGTRLPRAYALVNQLEYFAELSCAYFWRGEYEPFDREALRTYDPVGFEMIERMWGVHKALETIYTSPETTKK